MKIMFNCKIEKNKKSLLGKEFETVNCGKCVVVDYKGCYNVIVEFHEPFCEVKCSMSSLRSGLVSNPMKPSVCGKGFVGVGKYSSKNKYLYSLWGTMMIRTSSPSFKLNHPAYKDVTVCDEWLNFQNFAKWCETQPFYNVKDDKGNSYQLDKDILVKGNKIYSPETCCFVPSALNLLLTKCNSSRGEHLIGVHLHKKTGKFQSSLRVNCKKVNLGYYNTSNEAFQVYKEAKEAYIKEVAEKWKGVISIRVYEALINYTVDVND